MCNHQMEAFTWIVFAMPEAMTDNFPATDLTPSLTPSFISTTSGTWDPLCCCRDDGVSWKSALEIDERPSKLRKRWLSSYFCFQNSKILNVGKFQHSNTVFKLFKPHINITLYSVYLLIHDKKQTLNLKLLA